jgi:aminoglycoside phosphotransferase (APT) family kinase protein
MSSPSFVVRQDIQSDEQVGKLEDGLSAYISSKWKVPTRVSGLTLVPGGAARATWRCTLFSADVSRGLIVHIDSGRQLLPTDEYAEYKTMEAVFRAGFPVPEPLFFEEDISWLGNPFSVTAEVPNCKTSPNDIPPTHREAIGRRKWHLLGQMTRLDPTKLDLETFLQPTCVETCALKQFKHWQKVMISNEIHPNPIANAAMRWLRRHPPPPAQKLTLVHGDYRTGNFLYSPTGEIKAILDWEMAHIGDPLEDLAWSLDQRQNVDHQPHLAGSLLPHHEAIRHWQEASGLDIDATAFRWWQVFSAFKALAIWTLSARMFQDGEEKRPFLARMGWLLIERQQRILVDYLSPHSTKLLYVYEP